MEQPELKLRRLNRTARIGAGVRHGGEGEILFGVGRRRGERERFVLDELRERSNSYRKRKSGGRVRKQREGWHADAVSSIRMHTLHSTMARLGPAFQILSVSVGSVTFRVLCPTSPRPIIL